MIGHNDHIRASLGSAVRAMRTKRRSLREKPFSTQRAIHFVGRNLMIAHTPSIVTATGPIVIGGADKKTDIKVTTGEPAQNAVPAADLTPATPVGKASADMPGYTEIDLKQIPGDVYALMGNGKLVISIGKDEFNMTNMTANAGGALGYQNGKAVAYCTLSADQPYEAIEKAETYTLKLYAPNQTTPSAVIECKKLPSQTTPQAGQPRTYVGEIVKLLMKK